MTATRLLTAMTAVVVATACASGPRLSLSGITPLRLEMTNNDGVRVATITDALQLRGFEQVTADLGPYFDDVFGETGDPQYRVRIIYAVGDRAAEGTLSISERHVRYLPGKGAAKITVAKRTELLRILGLTDGSGGQP